MIYPDGCMIQKYDPTAMRLTKLRRFHDVAAPQEGPAIISALNCQIINGKIGPFQTGDQYVSGSPAALDFDLSLFLEQNKLSYLRSIGLYFMSQDFDSLNSIIAALRFDNGISLGCGSLCVAIVNTQAQPNGQWCVFDFLCDVPKFSIQCSKDVMIQPIYMNVFVSNFKLDTINVPCGADPLYIASYQS